MATKTKTVIQAVRSAAKPFKGVGWLLHSARCSAVLNRSKVPQMEIMKKTKSKDIKGQTLGDLFPSLLTSAHDCIRMHGGKEDPNNPYFDDKITYEGIVLNGVYDATLDSYVVKKASHIPWTLHLFFEVDVPKSDSVFVCCTFEYANLNSDASDAWELIKQCLTKEEQSADDAYGRQCKLSLFMDRKNNKPAIMDAFPKTKTVKAKASRN